MTPEIAADLRIVGGAAAADWDTFQPEFTAMVFPGSVRLKWVKGPMDSIQFYTRLRGQMGWTFLARAVVGDEEVGVPSTIFSAVFGG